MPTASFLGAAIPPVPHKIEESGAVAEVGELQQANLRLTEDELKQRLKHHRVLSITEWLQGYAVYVTVLSYPTASQSGGTNRQFSRLTQ